MACGKVSLITLMVVCCFYSAYSITWIGTYDWAVVTTLGESVAFECVLKDNGTHVLPANHSVVVGSERWQLVGESSLKGPYYPIGNKFINGNQLNISNITLADKGIYHCHVELECDSMISDCNTTEMWYKHGLNLNGPIYTDLMQKYQRNFITGAIASGSVIVVFGLLCLMNKFRYKEPQGPEEDDINLTSYKGPATTSPPAFGDATSAM